MTPRPRKVSDDEVFAAALRAMSRFGPGELTLTEIASEAGVTAGALVQRFGSKRAMLLALAARAGDSADEFIRQLHETHGSALAALRAYSGCMAHLAESPAALARNLAYLQIDLTDPDFRKHLLVQARSTRAGLESLVKAAVAEKELIPRINIRVLARTIEAVLSGSMMMWGFYRQGATARWMRDDLDAILAPYLVKQASIRRMIHSGPPPRRPPRSPRSPR